MTAFTFAFLIALALSTLTRLALAGRQIRHVRAHRDAVPAAFAAQIPLEAHRKAADYTVARTRLEMIETPIALLVVLALTVGGGLQRLSNAWASVFTPSGYAHGVAVVASVALLVGAIGLPFNAYRVFAIEQRFGFNRLTPRLFVADLLREIVLAALLGAPLLLAALWLMRNAGAWWWLAAWALWVTFNLGLAIAYPVLIAPLFNRFTPLTDPALAERIRALLERCGFRAEGLFVMDGSRRSSHGNAYFTGLGAVKRIVLFDTLLERLAPAEVEAVLAHELGHFALRHVWKRIALFSVASLLLLGALGWLAREPWFFRSLGVDTESPALALLLFALAAPPFLFPLRPLAALYSRRHEFEADAYAAQHSQAAELARALVKLYRDNAATLTPDPLHSAFYDSHPPAPQRIARLQPA